jgi:hypothetical protein
MDKISEFYRAAKEGDLDKVKNLNENCLKLSIRVSSSILNHALNRSIVNGHLNVVKYFIGLECYDEKMLYDALSFSITSRRAEIIKYFVNSGLDPKRCEDSLKTCVFLGYISTIEYLTSLGCDFAKEKLHTGHTIFGAKISPLNAYNLTIINCLDKLGWDFKKEIPKFNQISDLIKLR